MGYIDGEILIASIIADTPYFSSENVGRNDWSVRNRSTNGVCVVLHRGSFDSVFDGLTRRLITWHTVIEIWQRLIEVETSARALYDRSQEITDAIDANRKLNDTTNTIIDAYIISGDEPNQMTLTNATHPTWLKQELICEWQEEKNITFTE